jgi:hypothetical protein
MKERNRLESDDAVVKMQTRGLHVTAVPPGLESEWRNMVEEKYAQLRGAKVPADLFDEVVRLLGEYRRANGQLAAGIRR